MSSPEMLCAYYRDELVEVLSMFELYGTACCEIRFMSDLVQGLGGRKVNVPANRLRATFAQIHAAARETREARQASEDGGIWA